MKEKEKEQSDAFDINKKVAEIPAEELDGFFHDIDLSEDSEETPKEKEDPKAEEKKPETSEEDDLKKSMLDGATFL